MHQQVIGVSLSTTPHSKWLWHRGQILMLIRTKVGNDIAFVQQPWRSMQDFHRVAEKNRHSL